MQTKLARTVLAGWIAAGLAGGAATGATAQQSSDKQRSTPDSFSWTYDKDGKVVRKGKAVTDADGKVREETRRGSCVRIKEKTEDGVRWVDKC